MKIQLEADKFVKVWGRKKDILEVQVSLDTEKLPHQAILRIKNALKRGYYGSGEDSNIGITISSIARTTNLPFIFCNRAYWTSGLTFLNLEEFRKDKVKEYVHSMAQIADIRLEMDRYYGRKFATGERWSIKPEKREVTQLTRHRSNIPVSREFAAILKGAMTFYTRELLTTAEKEKLKQSTETF